MSKGITKKPGITTKTTVCIRATKKTTAEIDIAMLDGHACFAITPGADLGVAIDLIGKLLAANPDWVKTGCKITVYERPATQGLMAAYECWLEPEAEQEIPGAKKRKPS